MTAMLFLLEERLLHQQTRPLLSGQDIRVLLSHFLPQWDNTLAEVLRQMEVLHRKHQLPSSRSTLCLRRRKRFRTGSHPSLWTERGGDSLSMDCELAALATHLADRHPF